MSQRFSAADVASHKTPNDLYIIVDEDVYDLTNFQEEHPGGKKSVFIMIPLVSPANTTQSFSALQARMPPNSSGSTTTTAS
jgi:cytochrome b involved in lipid metabolism